MGFMKAILDSIPPEQQSGLEKPMAEFVKGLAGSAAAMGAIHSAGAAMGSFGVSVASEGASNAGAPMNAAIGPRGID